MSDRAPSRVGDWRRALSFREVESRNKCRAIGDAPRPALAPPLRPPREGPERAREAKGGDAGTRRPPLNGCVWRLQVVAIEATARPRRFAGGR